MNRVQRHQTSNMISSKCADMGPKTEEESWQLGCEGLGYDYISASKITWGTILIKQLYLRWGFRLQLCLGK